ncbi:MAG: 3-isopropylmalate dehydratase [Gammaproteobacteria bacterium]|nr:3-isopropylmalate dehydratase [Gammaproteobacteria bacterium]
MNDHPQAAGRAWVYGDGIDTDVMAPSAYLNKPPEEVIHHCMEAVDPGFASGVRPGDIFVAGEALGVGSSREQAPQNLKSLGIRFVLAKSYGRIFYRNALNIGLPALICDSVDQIQPGDELNIDPMTGRVENLTRGEVIECEPLPEHLIDMIADGGLIPHLQKKLAKKAEGERS